MFVRERMSDEEFRKSSGSGRWVAAVPFASISLAEDTDMGWKSISVKLLLCALSVALASSGCGVAQSAERPYRVVASIDEVMDAIVIPSSQIIFDAVVYSN